MVQRQASNGPGATSLRGAGGWFWLLAAPPPPQQALRQPSGDAPSPAAALSAAPTAQAPSSPKLAPHAMQPAHGPPPHLGHSWLSVSAWGWRGGARPARCRRRERRCAARASSAAAAPGAAQNIPPPLGLRVHRQGFSVLGGLGWVQYGVLGAHQVGAVSWECRPAHSPGWNRKCAVAPRAGALYCLRCSNSWVTYGGTHTPRVSIQSSDSPLAGICGSGPLGACTSGQAPAAPSSSSPPSCDKSTNPYSPGGACSTRWGGWHCGGWHPARPCQALLAWSPVSRP